MRENIDLKGFKVVHGEKVLNALAIVFIDIMVINEDGNILIVHDEA